MSRAEARAWAASLDLPVAVRRAAAGYPLVLFLLGERYLEAIEPPLLPQEGQRYLWVAKPPLFPSLRAPGCSMVPAGIDEVRLFRSGLVALKGRMFLLLARALAAGGEELYTALLGDDSGTACLAAMQAGAGYSAGGAVARETATGVEAAWAKTSVVTGGEHLRSGEGAGVAPDPGTSTDAVAAALERLRSRVRAGDAFTTLGQARRNVIADVTDAAVLVQTDRSRAPQRVLWAWIEAALTVLWQQGSVTSDDLPGAARYRSAFVLALLARKLPDLVRVEAGRPFRLWVR